MSENQPQGLRYAGGGFVPGVPARDLTAEEVAAHDAKRLIASGLYAPYPTPETKRGRGPQENKEA